MFEKDTNLTKNEIDNLKGICIIRNKFKLTTWVEFEKMTEEEKKNHPKVIKGYLKTFSYKQAWANLWEDITREEKQAILDLPNFDKDIFYKITGIEVQFLKIQVDTREKDNNYILDFFDKIGVGYISHSLPFGDYALTNDFSICVDKKSAYSGLIELSGNIVHDHERFKKELIGAKECGIKLIFLIQEEDVYCIDDVYHWQNPRYLNWVKVTNCQKQGKMLNYKIAKKPPVNGKTLFEQMITIKEKYGCEFEFAKKNDMGAKIIELLTGIQHERGKGFEQRRKRIDKKPI